MRQRPEGAVLQNYLTAALRNLFRHRAYAAINLFGLALGFTAAALIALYVRDEYSYDRMFPGYQRLFAVQETITLPGRAAIEGNQTFSDVGAALRLDLPEIEDTARIVRPQGLVVLRRGERSGSVLDAFWADPNFFDLFPMKVIAGHLANALGQPDNIVLTRKIARRFFDREDVAGETIELDRAHVMRVTAVIEDLPSNTHLSGDVFLPGVASFSELSRQDSIKWGTTAIKSSEVYTYARFRPGANVERVNSSMRDFVSRHFPGEFNGLPLSQIVTTSLSPVTDIHLGPRHIDAIKPQGDRHTLHALIGIGVLILFVAGSNFVSMMTARALRRAVEVGVRKSVGATRRQIAFQFMGECLFYTAVALVIALIAVALALPAFDGFLQRDIGFDFVRDPFLFAAAIAVAAITGLAAGAYPSLVLSAFRPSSVLRGTAVLTGGSGRLRQALVILQFATLIALIVMTLTIHTQTQYALQERLRLPGDTIYLRFGGCREMFAETVEHLPGVLAVSCASAPAVAQSHWGGGFALPNGGTVSIETAMVDYGFFNLFGIRPLAGRLLAPDRGEDDVLRGGDDVDANPAIVLNESAVRALGFDSAQHAVGQYRRWTRPKVMSGAPGSTESMSSQIVGVVPDFSLGSVRDVIEPTAYYIDPPMADFAVILKLRGGEIPETLRALQDLWARQDSVAPFEGMFLSQYLQSLYSDISRQSRIFSAFSGVAVVLAALGLLGLATYTAERRTKEIGLRKVMGATRRDILRFLGWQFARPVLWANLIAWPCAYIFMRRWLEGFAYHISLGLLTFLAAAALALGVAFATVAGHTFLVARAKPVDALRYE
jgi:putative ABC transport system permease protein